MPRLLLLLALGACAAGDPAGPLAQVSLEPRLPISERVGSQPELLSESVRRPWRVAVGPFRFTEVLELPAVAGAEVVSGGLALLDFDEDGDLDLFVARLESPSQLLRNDGDMVFTPEPGDAGIPQVGAFGAALGDCDADGHVDLLVTGVERTALVRNLGGRFRELIDAVPELPFRPGSALLVDVDGDLDLDLYVTCYHGELGGPCDDRLLMNDGTCRFTDESWQRGPLGTGLGHAVGALDVDDDGDPDLVVANDVGFDAVPDQLLENDGTGHFTEAGSSFGLDQRAFSMSAQVADVDGDGRLDVYKGNICRSPLLLGRGPGLGFEDGGRDLGLPPGWIPAADAPPLDLPEVDPGNPPPRGEARFVWEYMLDRPDAHARCLTTWATETPDLDADGRVELFLASGAVGHRYEAPSMPDQLWWRPPGEATFVEVAGSAGLDGTGRGRSAVFADLDGDGLQDLVLGNAFYAGPTDRPGSVLANRGSTSGNSLLVTLRGPGANRDGIGAVVEVIAGGRRQVKLRTFGTSFLAASAAPLHFGLGEAHRADRVIVHWPWKLGQDVVHDVPAGELGVAYGSTGP